MRAFIDDSFVTFAFVVFTVPVLLIYGFAVVDLVTRGGLSWLRKAGWGLGIVLLPAIGIVTYYVMRPAAPPPGKNPDTMDTGVARAAEDLRAQWREGVLGEAAYLEAKRELFRV